MRIVQSNLQFASHHAASAELTTSQSLRFWRNPPGQVPTGGPPTTTGSGPAAVLMLSGSPIGPQLPSAEAAAPPAELDDLAESDPRLSMVKLVVEVMIGRKVEVLSARQLSQPVKPVDLPATGQPAAPGTGTPAPFGWGAVAEWHSRYQEQEQTTVTATGRLTTADGQTIALSLSLTMARQFQLEQSGQLRLGDAARQKDPLVINFGATAAQLTGPQIAFDLDLDGQRDQITFVGPGSGLLVLDRNGDGQVNDGRELFGAASGNGFAELAAFDRDATGWIDAADPIFDRLRLWTGGSAEQPQLAGLADHGVGAIGLAHIASPFALKDDQNRSLGQIRATGLYLGQAAVAAGQAAVAAGQITVGTVQQLDLIV